jgi:hypothetical protein
MCTCWSDRTAAARRRRFIRLLRCLPRPLPSTSPSSGGFDRRNGAEFTCSALAVRSGGAVHEEETRNTIQRGPYSGLVTFSTAPAALGPFDLWRDDVTDGGEFGPRAYAWTAFAYSGNRSFEHGVVSKLEEDTSPPLVGSLGFSAVDDSRKLANWVAAQQFKRLKALEAGQLERAEQFGQSIGSIEAAVRRIIGSDFSFHSSVDDLNVRVKLNGDVVDFDLVPAGVKSIVSWIADLLMRMDRIQWEGSLPVTQRPFLLLLDEIDIHLHPAWQRKLLPAVQRLFPKAQIIASTHSPFVVASLADGAVIELKLDEKGRSTAQPPLPAPLELSYSATMQRDRKAAQ